MLTSVAEIMLCAHWMDILATHEDTPPPVDHPARDVSSYHFAIALQLPVQAEQKAASLDNADFPPTFSLTTRSHQGKGNS